MARKMPQRLTGYLAGLLVAIGTVGGLMGCAPGWQEPGVDFQGVALDSSDLAVRRLTDEQYKNIISDIFGPTVQLGGRFEPDLRIDGLLAVGASHISVTATGMEQYDAMARAIAAQVVDEKRRGMMISCQPASAKEPDDGCVRQVMADVGRLLYRRPLTQMELNTFVAAANVGTRKTQDFYSGLSLSLAAMLSSPKFIFRQEIAELDPARPGEYRLNAYSMASRLSFFLWNSGPDPLLLEAAASGEMNTQDGLAKQVDRMLTSPRLEAGVRAFFRDNFGFEEFATLTKDTELFPKFSTQAAEDAQEQTLRTIVDLLVARRGDYRDIFTTKKTFLTQELAAVYRVPLANPLPNGSPDMWRPYEFPPDDLRGGILTHMSFTALHSPSGRGSPTLRGKAMREVILCQKVPAPPGDVDFTLVNNTTSHNTARERLTAHATEPMCKGCHKIMDPLGLGLENFDAAGAWRTTENGALIDTGGKFDGITFKSVVELGRAIHDHPAVTSCLVNRLSAYALGRLQGSVWLRGLEQRFAASGYRLPELMQQIAIDKSFYEVVPETLGGSSPQSAMAAAGQ
jgi:hypothetical protein